MIHLPETIWDQVLKAFAGKRRTREQVAYFDGVRIPDGGVITTVTLPDATMLPGNFHVSADAMSKAGTHLRTLHLSRLAQIHTHPEEWVGHSRWDDVHAYSQQAGAVSIVLPCYGQGKPTLQQAGIHVRTPQGWQQLNAEEALTVIRILPSKLDFRRRTKQK